MLITWGAHAPARYCTYNNNLQVYKHTWGPFKGKKPYSYNLANDLVCIDIIETGSFIP